MELIIGLEGEEEFAVLWVIQERWREWREKVSKMILKKEEDEKKKRQTRQRKEQIKNIIVNALINPSQTFDLEELKIDDNLSSRDYGDNLKFILKGSQFPLLKRTIIGKNCFRFIKRFEIDMLPVLGEVEIGNDSFFLREDLNIDSSCSITNCLNLKTIIFGRGCFYYYRKVKISRCSIQSLDISKYCMWYSDLMLQGMNLKNKTIGLYCSRSFFIRNSFLRKEYFHLVSGGII